MAVAAVEEPLSFMSPANTKPPFTRVCFSFAAYAKNVLNYLYSSNVPLDAGLSESEFAAVESAFNFSFPPDLRSILQEGLPVGAGFPNWRSSSHQQLQILTNLPILGICKEVSRNAFWVDSWGERPADGDRAAVVARGFLRAAPLLVPIYRNFYIPSAPCAAGNPVFYVHGGDVRVWSFDIAGFFQRAEFGKGGGCGEEEVFTFRRPRARAFPAPAWAATEARRIEFWTEMAAAAARGGTRGWWSGELGGCLEEVCWRLRDGGWKEEDVREMMMIDGGGCEDAAVGSGWRVRSMSERLLGAGWSTEDVVELLGVPHDFDRSGEDDGDYCFDFRRRQSCDVVESANTAHKTQAKTMATAIVRSALRSALRGGASTPRVSPASRRSFSASSHHDAAAEAAEAAKWEKITYLGIAACTTLAVVILSKGHAHYDEPPAYPYLHIRNKEFPWGPDGLFEVKEHH